MGSFYWTFYRGLKQYLEKVIVNKVKYENHNTYLADLIMYSECDHYYAVKHVDYQLFIYIFELDE